MIELKKTTKIIEEELYKQLKNAINNGCTYLKLKVDNASYVYTCKKNTFYFRIEKDGDDSIDVYIIDDIDDYTHDYFEVNKSFFSTHRVLSFEKPIFIPLPPVKGKKRTKKQKEDAKITFNVNDKFFKEINSEYSVVEFLTKEEYRIANLETTLYDLQRRLEDLQKRTEHAEENIKTLDEKKSNKFFI